MGALDTILTSIHGRRLGLDDAGRLLVRPKNNDLAPLGALLFNSVAASTAVANTTTETLFDQNFTIKANTLKVGSLLQIKYQGIAPATNSTDTLAIKLYIGGLTGTALISAAAVDVANNDVFSGDFEVAFRTVGANGTMVGTGIYKTTAAAGTMTAKDAILASTAIDTTVDQVVGVSATWSVANAGNSCRLDFLRGILH